MSETMSETVGKVAWFELPAKDAKRAQAFMSYVFMVIHRPKPGHRDDLARGMVERAELMAGRPCFLEAGRQLLSRCIQRPAAAAAAY
jgi:predicted enzyme related to lactoylglutathione lyase